MMIDIVDKRFGRELKIVRAMPNTPALVGEGMSALTPNELVSESDLAAVLSLFESFGKALTVPENAVQIVTSDTDELAEQPIENGTAAVKPRSVNTFLFERASV